MLTLRPHLVVSRLHGYYAEVPGHLAPDFFSILFLFFFSFPTDRPKIRKRIRQETKKKRGWPKPNKNKMAGVNSRFASVSESIFNGFLLKMVLRSLSVYILKQLFFSISVNSGRIFTSPLRGSVNILPLFTSISKINWLMRTLTLVTL